MLHRTGDGPSGKQSALAHGKLSAYVAAQEVLLDNSALSSDLGIHVPSI